MTNIFHIPGFRLWLFLIKCLIVIIAQRKISVKRKWKEQNEKKKVWLTTKFFYNFDTYKLFRSNASFFLLRKEAFELNMVITEPIFNLDGLKEKRKSSFFFLKGHWTDYLLGRELLAANGSYPHCQWTMELHPTYKKLMGIIVWMLRQSDTVTNVMTQQ